MEMILNIDRYWAKAKPACAGGTDRHPFVCHYLDAATVAAALTDRSSAIRSAFGSALDTSSVDETTRLRAWALLFVALHDLGKLRNLGSKRALLKTVPLFGYES